MRTIPGGLTEAEASANPAAARDRNVSFNAGEAISQQRAGLLYRHDRENAALMIRNYYVWRDFTNLLPFTSGGAVDLERFFYGAGVQYSGRYLQNDSLELTAGIDADRQDDERRRFDNNSGTVGNLVFDQNEKVTSTGAYLHGRYRMSNAWSLLAGARYDRIQYAVADNFLSDGDDSGRIDFTELSSSFAVNYAFSSGVVFVSFATSFETPTTTELANPDGSGGFNESLDAQGSTSYEVGFKQARGSLNYEIALFHIDLEDELVPFELAAFPGRTFFVNAGRSSRDGLEVALSWQGESGLRTDLSYTWSDFAFDEFVDDNGNDFAGNKIPGLPRQFAYARLSYDNDHGFYGSIEANYSGQLYANNANSVEVPSYVVANMKIAYRGQNGRWLLEPFVGINNIFDESYNSNIRSNAFGGRYFEPAPIRNYYAGIVIRFE